MAVVILSLAAILLHYINKYIITHQSRKSPHIHANVAMEKIAFAGNFCKKATKNRGEKMGRLPMVLQTAVVEVIRAVDRGGSHNGKNLESAK